MSYQLIRSGDNLYLDKPDFGRVSLEDVAHCLSLICRYAGNCSRHYSVAEHSCRVAMRTPPKHRKHALLHDATEMITSDIPSAVKDIIPEIRLFENVIWASICKRFDIKPGMPSEVKLADKQLVVLESLQLMPRPITPDEMGIEEFACAPELEGPYGWPADKARELWLRMSIQAGLR